VCDLKPHEGLEIEVTPEMVATVMRYLRTRYEESERLLADASELDVQDMLKVALRAQACDKAPHIHN
jgi:uncharacterized Zn finger protein